MDYLFPALVFGGLLVGLAAALTLAEKLLVNYGICKIDVNAGDRELEVDGGQSLLSALNESKIFIPSACGGRARAVCARALGTRPRRTGRRLRRSARGRAGASPGAGRRLPARGTRRRPPPRLHNYRHYTQLTGACLVNPRTTRAANCPPVEGLPVTVLTSTRI